MALPWSSRSCASEQNMSVSKSIDRMRSMEPRMTSLQGDVHTSWPGSGRARDLACLVQWGVCCARLSCWLRGWGCEGWRKSSPPSDISARVTVKPSQEENPLDMYIHKLRESRYRYIPTPLLASPAFSSAILSLPQIRTPCHSSTRPRNPQNDCVCAPMPNWPWLSGLVTAVQCSVDCQGPGASLPWTVILMGTHWSFPYTEKGMQCCRNSTDRKAQEGESKSKRRKTMRCRARA